VDVVGQVVESSSLSPGAFLRRFPWSGRSGRIGCLLAAGKSGAIGSAATDQTDAVLLLFCGDSYRIRLAGLRWDVGRTVDPPGGLPTPVTVTSCAHPLRTRLFFVATRLRRSLRGAAGTFSSIGAGAQIFTVTS
jgi:hypothetical protein